MLVKKGLNGKNCLKFILPSSFYIDMKAVFDFAKRAAKIYNFIIY
jgi:hypothetical protein